MHDVVVAFMLTTGFAVPRTACTISPALRVITVNVNSPLEKNLLLKMTTFCVSCITSKAWTLPQQNETIKKVGEMNFMLKHAPFWPVL